MGANAFVIIVKLQSVGRKDATKQVPSEACGDPNCRKNHPVSELMNIIAIS
jgi:hypothetical protein